MFTILKNWFETRSVRSDIGIVKQEIRAIRRLNRDIAKDKQLAELIDAGFTSGQEEKIHDAFERYFKLITDEVKDLQLYIIGYKILVRRTVESLELLEQDIKMNSAEQHKQELLDAIAKMEAEMLQNFKNFFASLASFESTSWSTQKLLSEASQVQDLFYRAQLLRKPARALGALITQEDRVERKGLSRAPDVEKKTYELLTGMLHTELEQQTKGLNNAFLLLQEIRADIDTKMQLIETEVRSDTYPPEWAEKNKKQIAPLRMGITAFIDDEKNQARILLNELERAQ